MYYWIIDKDLCNEDLEGTNCSSHDHLTDKLKAERKPHNFSLYDDDDNCMAMGRLWLSEKSEGSEQLFAPLDDFGTPSLGCTYIKVDGKIV
jgi:hypothetical protein